MKTTTFFLAFSMALQFSYAQPTKETREAIDKFNFMEGVWKGVGWTIIQGKKQQFRETETVTKKLNGSTILFESFGAALEDSNNIIIDAISILSYNEATKKYILRIIMPDGSLGEADASITQPSTFEWRLKYAGVYLKYLHEVKSKIWMVKGFHSSDGINWNQIAETELSKQ